MANHGTIQKFTPTLHNDTYPFISSSKANLSGRNVLITGASKGIGQAVARSFGQAGASGIILLARSALGETKDLVYSAAEKAGRAQPKVLMIKCDTTSEKDVDAAAKQVAEVFGRIDVVINNAGYLETWKPVAETDPSEWWKTWEVNVKGTYLVSRASIPLLLKPAAAEAEGAGLKTIVTMTSMGGISTRPHASAYQSSKTAQIRLTNFLCADYKEEGLLAFSVHPGSVKTELAQGMPAYMHEMLKDTPELVGDSMVWLTGERREWLRDRFVSVSWDMEELEAKRGEIEERDLLKFKMAV